MKKLLKVLAVLIITIVFVSGFSTSADAASQTFTSKYGNGYEKYFWVEQKNGLILELYAHYNVNEKGITITSASSTKKEVLFPFSVVNHKPKIVTAKTNGTSETAKVYGDFDTYVFKAWKLGELYQTSDRLTLTFKVTKIDKSKKTVTYTVSGY